MDDYVDPVGVALVVVMVVALFIVGLIADSTVETCPDYGYVSVTVDDELSCVPWEQAPELQDLIGS